MFIKNYTNRLIQKLNSNSNGITFRGGSLLQVANDKFQFTTFSNFYTPTTTAYVPVMFDYVSSPKNIPDKDKYEYTASITFALAGENETELENQRLAIDAFRASLINTPLDTLTIGSKTYEIVTSATDISLVREVVIVNSEKRVLVSMQVFIQSGIGSVYGNDRVVELKLNVDGTQFVELQPYEFNVIMATQPDSEMELSQSNVESIARNRTTTFNMRLYHEDTALIQEILKDIFGVSDLDRTYKMRFKVPDNAQAFVGGNNGLTVMLADGSINTSLGSNNVLDLNFKVYYE